MHFVGKLSTRAKSNSLYSVVYDRKVSFNYSLRYKNSFSNSNQQFLKRMEQM